MPVTWLAQYETTRRKILFTGELCDSTKVRKLRPFYIIDSCGTCVLAETGTNEPSSRARNRTDGADAAARDPEVENETRERQVRWESSPIHTYTRAAKKHFLVRPLRAAASGRRTSASAAAGRWCLGGTGYRAGS